MHLFTQDKNQRYKRIEKRKDEKNRKQPAHNQPTPKIWTVTLFNPKPNDRIAYYVVNPGRLVDLNDVAEKLSKLYEMDVWVYESLFGCFEVYLDQRVEVRRIEECTLKALMQKDEQS